MNGFVNRVADNLNRKRLDVVECELSPSGNIESLLVDEYREDSNVSQVGTKLSKEGIEDAIYNYILKNFFALNINADCKNVQLIGNQTKTIAISRQTRLLYATVIEKGVCNISVSNGTEDEPLFINFSFNTLPTSSTSIPYEIDLYLDSAKTKYLCTISGTVLFTPDSTSNSD